ncbi:hypothetical protein NEMIN01_2239 [Nematocida minor]|uniref:uncharacterized protein n=1 Tax=Nematocida minor TaxID=1912983 RepID=UPI00221E5DFC|nr:uncharacterized protein NEMIN01_2239 [Nematocida minor]KAI5192823.1 hypothetical protein NEMIN01_2239 [Nematocida minor]
MELNLEETADHSGNTEEKSQKNKTEKEEDHEGAQPDREQTILEEGVGLTQESANTEGAENVFSFSLDKKSQEKPPVEEPAVLSQNGNMFERVNAIVSKYDIGWHEMYELPEMPNLRKATFMSRIVLELEENPDLSDVDVIQKALSATESIINTLVRVGKENAEIIDVNAYYKILDEYFLNNLLSNMNKVDEYVMHDLCKAINAHSASSELYKIYGPLNGINYSDMEWGDTTGAKKALVSNDESGMPRIIRVMEILKMHGGSLSRYNKNTKTYETNFDALNLSYDDMLSLYIFAKEAAYGMILIGIRSSNTTFSFQNGSAEEQIAFIDKLFRFLTKGEWKRKNDDWANDISAMFQIKYENMYFRDSLECVKYGVYPLENLYCGKEHLKVFKYQYKQWHDAVRDLFKIKYENNSQNHIDKILRETEEEINIIFPAVTARPAEPATATGTTAGPNAEGTTATTANTFARQLKRKSVLNIQLACVVVFVVLVILVKLSEYILLKKLEV